jgi:hypothetical protein
MLVMNTTYCDECETPTDIEYLIAANLPTMPVDDEPRADWGYGQKPQDDSWEAVPSYARVVRCDRRHNGLPLARGI